MSPGQYLRTLWLSMARIFLTAEPPSSVSVRFGYSDIRNFHRAFKSEFETTPSKFRWSRRLAPEDFDRK